MYLESILYKRCAGSVWFSHVNKARDDRSLARGVTDPQGGIICLSYHPLLWEVYAVPVFRILLGPALALYNQ